MQVCWHQYLYLQTTRQRPAAMQKASEDSPAQAEQAELEFLCLEVFVCLRDLVGVVPKHSARRRLCSLNLLSATFQAANPDHVVWHLT